MTLRELQGIIDRLRRARRRARPRAHFMWVVDEVGELAWAPRSDDRAHLTEGSSDVLAWLTASASLAGADIDAAAARFQRGCPKGGKLSCARIRGDGE